jgi:hypothetical protein
MNNLSTVYTHEFKVCGATRSIYNGSLVLYGEFSEIQVRPRLCFVSGKALALEHRHK